MPRYELIKSIEARKLNKRSRLPMSGPAATIPFAALLDQVTRERDDVTFVHLTDLYLCPFEVFSEAARPLEGETPSPSAATEPAAAAPVSDSGATAAAAPAPQVRAELMWEDLRSSRYRMARASVPGGWLVSLKDGEAVSLTFYPDPAHQWTGN